LAKRDELFAADAVEEVEAGSQHSNITGTTVGTKRGLDISPIDTITVAEENKSVISTLNSSTTPLVDAGIFTGTAEDVSSFATMTVYVDTDLDGTLSMEFSSDGTNWDRQRNVAIDQNIESGTVQTLEMVSQYFRVVYTNSTGNGTQGHFRLQSIYHTFRSGFLTSSPDQVISASNNAQIVRVANDPALDISRGLYADKFSIHRFGFNSAVPNGTFADVWAYGPTDPTYNWPTTDETFRVAAGGDVNDTAGGTGARTIQIQYLDSTGVLQQDQLTLAGASASTATSVTGRRIFRAWVDTTGTINGSNTGAIIIENSTSNQIVGVITAATGQTQLTQYTVPLNYTAYLSRIEVSVATGANKDADVRMWQRQNAYTVAAPFGAKRLIRQWVAIQGSLNGIKYDSLPVFPALTDLWLDARGNGAVTGIDADYDLILVKNESGLVIQ
jgi:hypothetical protein